MDYSFPKTWSFEDDCERIGPTNESSTSSDEFEVVPVKQASEFEVIPQQKVCCLDEEELEIHENHFLFGSSGSQDSDSEIEVIGKSSEKINGKELYAQVLQKNIDLNQAVDCDSDEDEEVDASAEEGTEDNDDSEIEVIADKTQNDDDSLEIVFSNDANDESECSINEAHVVQTKVSFAHQESIDFEDYGIKSLFEETLEEPFEPNEDFVSVKTSTLIIVFCCCVLTGVLMGSGFGLLCLNIRRSEPTDIKGSTEIPPELYLLSERRRFNVTSICSSSNTKRNLKVLLASYRKLEEEHEMLKLSMEEMQEQHHMQTLMALHWKKQAKKHIIHDKHPIPKIYDGLMLMEKEKMEGNVKIKNETTTFRSSEEKQIILDLKMQLEEEKKNSQFWKDRYSSIKLSKMRKCARWAKMLPTSNFSFSACLTMFSNVLPNLNITSKLSNFTKPVETLADHVHNAWYKFKSKWNRPNDDVRQRNKDRFRKMLKISNVISAFRTKKEAPSTSSDKSYCSDEAFRMFQERWRQYSKVTFPKPQTDKKMNMEKSILNTINNVNDGNDEDMVVIGPSSALRKKNERKKHIKVRGKDRERGNSKQKNVKQEARSKKKLETPGDSEVWFSNKLHNLKFQFDVYRWEIIGQIKKMEYEMKKNIKNEKQKIKKKALAILKKERTKHKKKIAEMKKDLEEKRSKLGEWMFQEKLDMKREIKMLKKKLKKQNDDYHRKIRKVKKLVKRHLQKQYQKLKNSNDRMKVLKRRMAKKIALYKTKYQIHNYEINALRKTYEELKKKYDTQWQQQEEESDDTPRWRFPIVYCPDQKNCQSEIRKNDHSAYTETSSYRLKDFLHDFSNHKSITPPKPLPPQRALHNKRNTQLTYSPTPVKPHLPHRSINSDQEACSKLLLVAPKPVPPSRIYSSPFEEHVRRPVSYFHDNASSIIDEAATPLHWLHYWKKENTDTFDEIDQAATIPLDWYIIWMQSRDSLRKQRDIEMSEDKLNWFIRMMKDREEKRNGYVPMNWYLKWMEGRRQKCSV